MNSAIAADLHEACKPPACSHLCRAQGLFVARVARHIALHHTDAALAAESLAAAAGWNTRTTAMAGIQKVRASSNSQDTTRGVEGDGRHGCGSLFPEGRQPTRPMRW